MKFHIKYNGNIVTDKGEPDVFEDDNPEVYLAIIANQMGNRLSSYTYEPVKELAPLADLKAALNSSVKPDITHVRTPLLNYTARQGEYGDVKYERANYIRPTASLPEDFKRLRGYLRAVLSHTVQMLDSMERYQAMDPTLSDTKAMKVACYAKDTDPGNDKVGPSNMPHIGGACASLNMALEQAVTAGLLPKDPGTPWKDKT